ncbi:MAG: hypothetical protein J3R72DRAFT_447576 [Linnemannia gamsii]|nr:MAG: hypothetical protein J3R72DRAFT_447576 [Linnemannia gamsii]
MSFMIMIINVYLAMITSYFPIVLFQLHPQKKIPPHLFIQYISSLICIYFTHSAFSLS